MDILTYNLNELERWFLMLFRISSMLLVMPFYGYSTIPINVRLAVSFLVTVVLFPVHPEMQLVLGTGVVSFFGAVIREVVIGLAIGLSTTMLFYGVQFAGHVIGHTMGFAIINVIDPQSDAHTPILGQLFHLLVLVLFILLGGHHFLLLAVDESFIRIPLGSGGFNPLVVEGFARLSADIFLVGIRFGAPVLVAILVAEIALGFVARTVPQMNVWILGFPLKIGVGLLLLAFSLPMFAYVFTKLYGPWQGNVVDFIRAFTNG